MRTLLAVMFAAGAVPIIALSTPAHAEPSAGPEGADAAFLGSLRGAGITYTDPDQAISAAQSVCSLMGSGESGLQLLSDLKRQNPAITTDGAAAFASIAARFYCPHQLAPTS